MATSKPEQRSTGLPPAYNPADHETRIRERWDTSGAFHADPQRVKNGKPPYSILIPPPNVTGALHLGHALNNTLQDILVRMHRMKGFEALWMPGTDHAGIATQTVVDKRLQHEGQPSLKDYKRLAAEGKPARELFIEKVRQWKDEYEERITNQLKLMGCSCDWERQRFTMDEFCARAVREAFFRLFKDGLIYRGKRLVNWDPVTQTALADDEVEMREVEGKFYYLRYPLVDTKGHPTAAQISAGRIVDHVTVATTRPETYLGDTAVAMNPNDPRAASLRGKFVKLPLVERVIPIIEDDYVVLPDPESSDAKAKFATGFLKVTPAHDENDYQLGERHGLDMINVMAPDATISDQHGWSDVGEASIFVGLSREEARKRVVEEFEARGLLEDVKPYTHSVGHSYRSHAPIEPYLSDQWYVEVTNDQLAGRAQRALAKEQLSGVRGLGPAARDQSSESDHTMSFHPARYAKAYEAWHENIRDWCISRQLWWGHRIPVFRAECAIPTSGSFPDSIDDAPGFVATLNSRLGQLSIASGLSDSFYAQLGRFSGSNREVYICTRTESASELWRRVATWINDESASTNSTAPPASVGISDPEMIRACIAIDEMLVTGSVASEPDPDVLDTWFSSALWPLSTLGWPDEDQHPQFKGMLEAFKPTSVLCTARDIITLWVSRMVMFNRYFANGQIPFRDVYIHPVIQDGDGKRMSKSAGNGVDPLDIIESHGADAMRFTLCQLASQTQDVRMPVERDERTGRNTSPKFDLGKRFCNKLWNASRFTMMMLNESEVTSESAGGDSLTQIDRWMLSRLAHAAARIEKAIASYEFNVYADTMYDLLWNEFCDWYLEAVKPTVKAKAAQQAVLRASLDCILRLLHPIAPFVTEAIYEELRRTPGRPLPAGVRLGSENGLADLSKQPAMLCVAAWPQFDDSLRDEELERRIARLQELVRTIRDTRSQHQAPPRKKAVLHTSEALAAEIAAAGGFVETLAVLESVTTAAPEGVSTPFTFAAEEHRLSGLVEETDSAAECERLTKALSELEQAIMALEKRLANPGYADKAPAHLVQQTRDQLTAKQSERDAVRAAMERLG